MDILQVSSLERVFLHKEPRLLCERMTCLGNERISWQVAYRHTEVWPRTATVSWESPLGDKVQVRRVGNVPGGFMTYLSSGDDPDYETRTPGLVPDLLEEIENPLILTGGLWGSLFVTLDPTGAAPGEYPVTVRLAVGDEVYETTMHITVLPALLPEQTLYFTQWFHADCIAEYYQEEVFSPSHWKHLESFLSVAARNGINLILTPVFTPPLDTAVGGERLTVQLVDVEVTEEEYTFGFRKLGKWIRLCQKVGIPNFEISHLFTQWGAEHAPKIMGKKNGKLEKLFGWETDAAGPEYRAFLAAFLPALRKYLRRLGVEKNCFFHISDEPHTKNLKTYLAAKEGAAPYLKGCRIMDALSDYEVYSCGAVDLPVISTGNVGTFIEKGYENPWVYYCCGQHKGASNRHLSMSLTRERILGVQMYKYKSMGFLQWGYNFYHTAWSLRMIDPYRTTDAEGAFPSGDAFSVYPGKEGALESLRLVVFMEALQDMRALEALEEKIGYEETLKVVEEGIPPITFTQAPTDPTWLLSLRERVNRLLAE